MPKITPVNLQPNPIITRASYDLENQLNACSPVIYNITHYLAISSTPSTNQTKKETGFDNRYEKYISPYIDDDEFKKITYQICFDVSINSQHPISIFSRFKLLLRKVPLDTYKESLKVASSIHLNRELLLAFWALEELKNQSYKCFWFATFQLPDTFVLTANKNIAKNTVIRRFIEKLESKLKFKIPSCLAVLERTGGYHLHMVFLADELSKEKLEIVIKQLSRKTCSSVNIHKTYKKHGINRPVDLGCIHYFAKEINNRYFGKSNVYISSELRLIMKTLKNNLIARYKENKTLFSIHGFNKNVVNYRILKHKKTLIDSVPD